MTTIQQVQQALALADFDTLSAHKIMMPLARTNQRPPEMSGQARIGSVLLLLYCHLDELHLVLTRRRDDLTSHAGQISFPGGQREDGESIEAAALRETYEEIGIETTAVTTLGTLTPIYIPPSDFEVHPFVGWFHSGKRPLFAPATGEVAEILEVPLRHLMDPSTRKETPWDLRGHRVTLPYYDLEGHIVWGATAIMLSEFLQRLRLIMRES
jgi:8-oxo-dGTP pyrophosphatase MutT (NUDIX family)